MNETHTVMKGDNGGPGEGVAGANAGGPKATDQARNWTGAQRLSAVRAVGTPSPKPHAAAKQKEQAAEVYRPS